MTGKEIIEYTVNQDTIRYRMKLGERWIIVGMPMVKDADPRSVGRFSGQYDRDKKPIWERDILELDIKTEFGSLIKGIGVMVFSDVGSAFVIEIINEAKETAFFEVQNAKVVGNLTDNPELVCPKEI